MRTRFWIPALLLIVLVLVVTACSSTPSKPTVVINSPPHGSQFREGEEVSFQSTAADAKGVTRVELLVDGAVVRTDSTPNPAGQTSFSLVQTWKATQGSHTISVRAYSLANAMSDPAVISISVAAGATNPTAIPVSSVPTSVAPTIAPTTAPTQAASSSSSSASSSSSSAPACTNNAAFVADVTVPDGTAFVANQAFNKIWRVKNTGSCNWGSDYKFVFAAGELMGAAASIAVPNTNAGATADLLVPMTAPATVGAHTAVWRLKAPSGTIFGTSLSVVINVIDPNAPPPPPTTAPPTPVPSTGCSGAPAISTFTVSPTALFSTDNVTLSWGEVTNADSVEIDQGVGGVGTPGSVVRNVAPNTTFTLTAKCGSTTATRQVTVGKSTLLLPPITLIHIFIVNSVTANSSSTGSFCGSRSYTFTGAVNATGTGDVQYRWEKDGVSVKTGSLHFGASGTLNVSDYPFTPNSTKTSGTVRLHVTSPADKASSDLNYSCLILIPIKP